MKKYLKLSNLEKLREELIKIKAFYVMSFVKGPTLSELFQLNLFNKEKRVKIFWVIANIY